MTTIRLSAVSYINTLPFLYGLRESALLTYPVELSLDYPSECARKLQTQEADVGLVPVAVIPQLKDYQIVTNYCIGAEGAVESVLLLSQQPYDQIDTILLDYQSRTSVALIKILAKEYWRISPHYLQAEAGYEQQIGQHTAGVIIGDRTFALRSQFEYAYDLAQLWYKFTGLPFVFAAWLGHKKLPKEFLAQFDAALSWGVEHIPELIAREQCKYPQVALNNYLMQAISYQFDAPKHKALSIFLEKISQVNPENHGKPEYIY